MDAFEAITQRHGIFRFKAEPVEHGLIERVLQAAISAPSPANTQPWEFIVVDDPDLTCQIADYLVDTQQEYVFRQLLQTPEPFIDQLLKLYEAFAQIPCFIEMMERVFGPNKVVLSDVFSGVTSGLAIRAQAESYSSQCAPRL